jgi:hypothetical protein
VALARTTRRGTAERAAGPPARPRAEPSQAARILGLQRHAGNRAVAGAITRQRAVQRGPVKAEETSPTETGAEASGLGDIACHVLPDAAVVALVRAYFAVRYPRASDALVHYLEGGGRDFPVNLTEMLLDNPRAKERVAKHIGGGHQVGDAGQWIDKTSGGAPIRQSDYDSEDWRLALGGIDQVDWEIVAGPARDGSMRVRISIVDPYEWHPDEDRGTQCLHETMERQKQKGARNYNAVGTGDVQLTV